MYIVNAVLKQHTPLPPVMSAEHHEIALFIAQSLHSRLSALESLHESRVSRVPQVPLGIGFDDIDRLLADAQRGLESVQNIEHTIQLYAELFNEIIRLCQQPNPDWGRILSAVLALLEGEDGIKARRDQQLINAIQNNLQTLEIIEQLHAHEIGLHSQFIGVNPFAVLDDARNVVRKVIEFKKTIEECTLKFKLIKDRIVGITTWDVLTIIQVIIDIIDIFNEEDIVKKERDRQLLLLVEDITKGFAISHGLIGQMRRVEESGIKLQPGEMLYCNLDDPFTDALSVIKQVLQIVEAIRNYEATIYNTVSKYNAIMAQLRNFPSSGNPSDIIPYAINLIKTIRGEEQVKVKRDLDLAGGMQIITKHLKAAGYQIV